MREILFRGVDEGTNEWVYGYYYEKPFEFGGEKRYYIFDDKTISKYNVLPETVGQYTGLTDKNGAKIFEGDIIIDNPKYPCPTKYCVCMDEDRRGYFPFACGDGCGCCESDVVYHPDWCEVIGNIHNNPELAQTSTERG